MAHLEKVEKMRERVKKELEHIPRGVKGSSQNLLRSAYWMKRMNSLGKDPKYKSKEEVLKASINTIKRRSPSFTPEYDTEFFELKEDEVDEKRH